MKQIIPLIVLAIFLASCSGENSDLDKAGLKGDISRVIEHQYEAVHKNDGWEPGKPGLYGHKVVEYDSEGKYVKSLALTHKGDTIGYTRVRWEDGEKVEESFHSLVNGRSTRTLMERVSDEQLNFEVWEGETLHYEGAAFMDSKGRTLSQVTVVDEREVTNHYEYDKDLLVKTYQEELSGEITGTQLYEYTEFDEKGNWTRRLIYLTEDRIVPELITTREYVYR